MKKKRLIGLLLTVALLIVAMVCQIVSASDEDNIAVIGKTDYLDKSDYLIKSREDYNKNGKLVRSTFFEYKTVTENKVVAKVTTETSASSTEQKVSRFYNNLGQLTKIYTEFDNTMYYDNEQDYYANGNDSFYIAQNYVGNTSAATEFSTYDPTLDGMISGKWLFNYDQKGRKTRMYKEDGSEEYTFSYIEDNEGRIITKNYQYRIVDGDNVDTGSGSVNITYTAEGSTHTETSTDENGDWNSINQLSYNKNNQLVQILNKIKYYDGVQITEKDYSYDENGNIATAINIFKDSSMDSYMKSVYTYVPFSDAMSSVEEMTHVVPEDLVMVEHYSGTQKSLNYGDDIAVTISKPHPSKVQTAGIQTYEDGTEYYLNEITEELDASKDQEFEFTLEGSDVGEYDPAPAKSFAIYDSNVFSEDHLVASVDKGNMEIVGATSLDENPVVEPANAGGSGMLMMALPLAVKADVNTGYNVSVKVPAGTLVAGNTYYFVLQDDMVVNEDSQKSTNTDIVFKFSTAKPHVHTEKTLPAKEATCTEPGLTEGKVCEECGEPLVAQKEIPALGHDYKDGVCTRCGAKDPDYKPEVPDESANDLDPSVNGIVQCPDGRWAMYKNGKVDTTCTTIAQNKYGWWRVENGYVNFEANGVYQNKNGWWKTKNGKVTFTEFGLFENENGIWRVEFSKVNFKANSIYKGKDGWYKTTDGKVTGKETGIFQNQFGWWYCKNSKVDFDFTGVASNQYGNWYVKSGKVDFTKIGMVKADGKTYMVMFGKVLFG